jgi:hypothetical protein
MPSASKFAANLPRFLLIWIVAVGAAFASVALFILVLSEFTMARFWEPWLTQFGVLGSSIAFALIALASGFTVGAVVGLALGRHSLRVTPIAGLLVAIAWLTSAVTYLGGDRPPWSSVIAATMLASGLIIGGVCLRHIRHA